MPQQHGEINLVTLFADVHYYFGSPDSKPVHHRFDKSSYVYLHHNPAQHRGRIEVANNPGSPEQDALAGNLDTVKVDYNHDHPTLFSLTVNRSQSNDSGDTSQWHLPTYDPQNQTKYMYPLYALDIYLWKEKEASQFLHGLRTVIPEQHLQIRGNVPTPSNHAEHRDTMSPVVQKLEQIAVSDRQNGRSSSVSTSHSTHPPPPPANTHQTQSPPNEPQNFAPMAYNPAAPAAPEPIAHREKTPPPADAENGTGLTQAALQDQAQFAPPPLQHQGSFGQQQQQQHQPYMPGPPSRQSSFPPAPIQTTGSPPSVQHQQYSQSPPQGLGRQPTMPYSPPPQTAVHAPTQYANYPSSPPPGQQQFSAYPQSAPPTQTQFQGFHGPTPSGYSQYSYSQNQQPPSDPYNIHSQAYRPTEGEAGHGYVPQQGPGQPGRFNQRMDKVEKGVSRFLKKLDNKY